MRRFLWCLLGLFILYAFTGCTSNTVAVGKNDLRVKAGEWLGQNDKGSVMIEFNVVSVGDAGANVVLLTYAYPCGEGSLSISTFDMANMDSPRPIKKAEIHDGAFEMQVDQAFLTPGRLVLTGEFIDSTHAEGTWEIFNHQVSDRVCSAAQGTWQGRPK